MDRLNALEEQIMTESGPEDERLEAIYQRLEELDPSTFEARARGAPALTAAAAAAASAQPALRCRRLRFVASEEREAPQPRNPSACRRRARRSCSTAWGSRRR